MSQQNSQQSPLIGKYMYVSELEYCQHDGWWGCVCYCESFSNGVYNVRTKFDKLYQAKIGQIKNLIDITATQQYQIGDTVYAGIEYYQYDGDYSYDYCKVISVSTFANDIEYKLQVIKSREIYTDVPQSRIKRKATLCKAIYSIGAYIGVSTTEGCQWDTYTVINNATITNVNEWYDKVTYTVRFTDGSMNSYILEENIVAPAVIKTQQQINQEDAIFLRDREQQLLFELERIRDMRKVL
jgi:hypothetical protein